MQELQTLLHILAMVSFGLMDRLFDDQTEKLGEEHLEFAPLAERMRPRTLKD